ncbi:MAG: hypothetical protein NVS1B10_06650 [Candidatus Saccharimonadales bacterium]
MSKLISSTLAAKERLKRGQRKEMQLDPAFTHQNALIADPARFISAQCGRRAGKTNGIAIRFFKTLERYPKAQCLYLSLTRESAFDILWPVLIEHNDAYNLGCTFTESNLTMKHPNGSKLKLLGADMKNFIKRIRGRKYPGVAIDEAQDFGNHLQSLVDDVLTPAIADYPDSWLLLTGTPGPVPQGYFFEITQQGKYGYSRHNWTMLENPYMPDPAKFISELKERRGWDDNHPSLLREYRNNWILDVESLWIRYSDAASYEELPHAKWNYILGIDLGYKDADALAVLAWSESQPATYLVEEVLTRGQEISGLVEQIEVLQRKYDISKMVIDQGGLGLKIAEEIRRRHHIPVIGAEKQRKQETVGFMNDALRRGTLKARKDSQFVKDSYLVQIDWDKTTPDRIVVKKNFHSDIIDSVLYAFKESPAYTYQAPKPAKASWGTREWAEAQVHEMENAAFDHFLALESENKAGNDDDWL